MDVDLNDFSNVVAETARRARDFQRPAAHPLEVNRKIDALQEDLRANSHALSIESHPEETTRNKAGQLARRLALNPAEQRRLNRSVVEVIAIMEDRARRQEEEIGRLRTQVDRLLAHQRGKMSP